MKKALPLVILWFAFSLFEVSLAAGLGCHFGQHPNIRTKMITGTIKEIRRNTILVFDETDRILRTLVDVSGSHGFSAGDRVSISYAVKDNTVESIKKVRFVEYKKNGQNLGYIKRS